VDGGAAGALSAVDLEIRTGGADPANWVARPIIESAHIGAKLYQLLTVLDSMSHSPTKNPENAMPAGRAASLIQAYYAAFNAGDMTGMLVLLDEAVAHDISQGPREIGRAAFSRFLEHMNRCYAEQIVDLVVMADASGTRASAEFTVNGRYIATDPGVPAGTPAARGQRYILPAGAFFELRDGRILRVSNHYNLGDWVSQITQADRGCSDVETA
jgi:steroid delta-isomerase-like uncharacterized protein